MTRGQFGIKVLLKYLENTLASENIELYFMVFRSTKYYGFKTKTFFKSMVFLNS
jgi:hypothetical protein